VLTMTRREQAMQGRGTNQARGNEENRIRGCGCLPSLADCVSAKRNWRPRAEVPQVRSPAAPMDLHSFQSIDTALSTSAQIDCIKRPATCTKFTKPQTLQHRMTTSQESGTFAKAGNAYQYRPWLHTFQFRRFKPRYLVLHGNSLLVCKTERDVFAPSRATVNIQARDPA
jgi:hypothetical protein